MRFCVSLPTPQSPWRWSPHGEGAVPARKCLLVTGTQRGEDSETPHPEHLVSKSSGIPGLSAASTVTKVLTHLRHARLCFVSPGRHVGHLEILPSHSPICNRAKGPRGRDRGRGQCAASPCDAQPKKPALDPNTFAPSPLQVNVPQGCGAAQSCFWAWPGCDN